MNIVFWNCQGLRPKRKELQNYLLENQIDILALNETFLKPKFKFHLPGYDIYRNDRLAGTKGGVAILVKKGIIVNQEWKNDHFNVITDNDSLAVEIELQNGDKVILATIYCPNGNPSLRLFRMINALSNQVIFLGDFNSKHKQFGCVKPNKSSQTLLSIAKDLKLFYVNQLEPNRHTCEDPVHGTSDILDMAFITPGLSSRDISFSVADDQMGSDHFPIQISLDKPLKRNTPLTEPRYRFDKTNDDLLHNTLKDSLTNIDTDITTQDELEGLAVTLCDKLMKAVDTSTPKVYSRNDPKSPISQAILDLIKEKRRLRQLYNNTQDPNIKSTINRLQKEIRTKINQESTVSWEKFCNSISLESDPKKSWRKITNFLKPKGPRSYPTLKLGNKTAKTNPEKVQLFAESVERNFGIESHLFSKSQFDRINKFVEAHSYHFTPLDSLHDNITDTDDDSDLVADVDPDTLIRIVRTELKNGKAPGIDNVYNIIPKKAIGIGFYNVLAQAFTISLKLGFIPHVWKVAVLCMLMKPDKPPSQTTSYRPISLLSAIMKVFERVIENVFENILKTTVSLGNTSQQMIIFFVSLRPSWKASIGENM